MGGITHIQARGDNQQTGKGIQDHMKTDKFRNPLFTETLDPQAKLETYRQSTVPGKENQHEENFIKLNRAAVCQVYLFSRFKPKDMKQPFPVQAKLQIALQSELCYKHLVLGEPVVAGSSYEALKTLTLIPRELVVKLGLVKKLREDTAGGGREDAIQRGRETAAAAAKTKEGKSKRKRLEQAPPGVSREDHFANKGKLTAAGEEYKKPGRKSGSKVDFATGKLQAPPGSSSKPVANKAKASSSGGGGGGSLMTPMLNETLEVVTEERVQELEAQNAEQAAQIVQLQDQLSQTKSNTQAKNVQVEGELRNRSNIALMQAMSTDRMDPEGLKGLMSEVSPFKMPPNRDSVDI